MGFSTGAFKDRVLLWGEVFNTHMYNTHMYYIYIYIFIYLYLFLLMHLSVHLYHFIAIGLYDLGSRASGFGGLGSRLRPKEL